MNKATKAYLAELLGTFTLVFIGGLAVTVANQQGLIIPALGHGLALVVIAFVYGGISGAHVNPAITVSLLLGRKIKPTEAVVYIAMQVVGALLAALLINLLLPSEGAGKAIGELTSANLMGAAALELVLTFLLGTTVWQTAVHGRAGNLAPLAIGFTLTACILAGGVYSGASLNPARTLGPALVDGNLSYVPIYIAAQFAGGILAWAVNAIVLTPEK